MQKFRRLAIANETIFWSLFSYEKSGADVQESIMRELGYERSHIIRE